MCARYVTDKRVCREARVPAEVVAALEEEADDYGLHAATSAAAALATMLRQPPSSARQAARVRDAPATRYQVDEVFAVAEEHLREALGAAQADDDLPAVSPRTLASLLWSATKLR